jgi:hypothetical protein
MKPSFCEILQMRPARGNHAAKIASVQVQVLLAATILLPLIVGGSVAPRASAQACSAQSSISFQFNGFGIGGGSYIWFNSAMKLISQVPSSGLTIDFSGQTVQSSAFSLAPPNSEVTFSWSAATATTTFNTTTNTWVTTVPAGFGDITFMSGLAYHVPNPGLSGETSPVIWNITVSGSTSFSIQWQWGAAVYASFSGDYNALGVKPLNSATLDSYQNGDPAGTPENFKSQVVPGATGNGGTNWTGSYSSAAAVSASCSPSTSQLTVTCEQPPYTTCNFFSRLYLDGHRVAKGFTPITFTLESGVTYFVEVEDYYPCSFQYWQDTGSTTNNRSISITSDTLIHAIYSCTTDLTVQSFDQYGNAITGYFVTLYDQGLNVLATGYTTVTFPGLTTGQAYILQADRRYHECVFSYWMETGGTKYQMDFTAMDATETFTAVYNCTST